MMYEWMQQLDEDTSRRKRDAENRAASRAAPLLADLKRRWPFFRWDVRVLAWGQGISISGDFVLGGQDHRFFRALDVWALLPGQGPDAQEVVVQEIGNFASGCVADAALAWRPGGEA
jgi:hypothetical protein